MIEEIPPIENLGRFDWMAEANCKGEDLAMFFPQHGGVNSDTISEDVANLCYRCPVMIQCLGYALLRSEKGTWGATIYRERDDARTVARTAIAKRYNLNKAQKAKISAEQLASYAFPLLVNTVVGRKEKWLKRMGSKPTNSNSAPLEKNDIMV